MAETKLVAMLQPAGLVPDRIRCEIRRLTQEGDLFEFHFVGRVKPIAEKAG